MLRIAVDFVALEAEGAETFLALETMRGRIGVYDPELLEIFARTVGVRTHSLEVAEIRLAGLEVGMRLVHDVRARDRRLLITRGHLVTAGTARAVEQLPARHRRRAAARGAPVTIREASGLAEPDAYQRLVEQVPAVVIVFALGRGLAPVYVSPQTEAILGVSVERLALAAARRAVADPSRRPGAAADEARAAGARDRGRARRAALAPPRRPRAVAARRVRRRDGGRPPPAGDAGGHHRGQARRGRAAPDRRRTAALAEARGGRPARRGRRARDQHADPGAGRHRRIPAGGVRGRPRPVRRGARRRRSRWPRRTRRSAYLRERVPAAFARASEGVDRVARIVRRWASRRTRWPTPPPI